MKYAYEDLSSKQFETLVVLIGQRLFGASMQGFADGIDGGRDAKFVGTANMFPSGSAPWVGITIAQAKHTYGYNRHFSETDFFNPRSAKNIIGKEVPRIKKLIAAGELNHYFLVANRRLAGGAESDIRNHIVKECGLSTTSIYLCGVEQLELYMKQFPEVATLADLDPVNSPLLVSPDDLAVVVQTLARHREAIGAVLDDPPTPRVSYEKKNKLNNMTPAYARELQKKYLKETQQIKTFLAAPENADILQLYESVSDEFQLKIISKRTDFQTFDAVMEYLSDLLYDRDPVLCQRPHKRLTRVMLFYMYWNCDIGETPDVAAN
jgi:hypothetical protein